MQMYDYAAELCFCEDHWKLNMIATTNYPSWYKKHILGEDSNKEDRGDLDKENHVKNDNYMHLPQKHGSTAALLASKKKKKKIPMSVETAALDSAQIPTSPASATSAHLSAASTLFTSSVELPALSDTLFEQG